MTTSGRLGPAPYKLPTNLDEHAERRGSRLGFRLGPASSLAGPGAFPASNQQGTVLAQAAGPPGFFS